MENTTITKKRNKVEMPIYKIKRDIEVWRAICGIWKRKGVKDIIKWQRKIRQEWERKIP
ncbi:hypothetical protein KJ636_01760 [Patescibacteria group bacterium]|nr:hypothetical protein [Patescibacteria group bacterium]MBU4480973.1 hypothetical protein [Patescibacteria group bacterium]